MIILNLLAAGCLPSSNTRNSAIALPTEFPITEEKAIAIAANYVPVQNIMDADITATLSISADAAKPSLWMVMFYDANITRDQLLNLGWQSDANTFFDNTETFKSVVINIDANTGAIIQKSAFNGIKLGGPPADYYPEPIYRQTWFLIVCPVVAFLLGVLIFYFWVPRRK